jgi:hypothetical protein
MCELDRTDHILATDLSNELLTRFPACHILLLLR